MPAWDAALYLKYEEERTRPARDLLAQVPLAEARLVYDLGCGPGNATKLLAARFPRAEIIGVDSSAEMLARARQALPNLTFEAADLSKWRPKRHADLLFANAVFQWVPDHMFVLRALVEGLPPGGVLAVQIPDNLAEHTQVLMTEIATRGSWAKKLAAAESTREKIAAPAAYYDFIRPLCRSVDIWHTIYQHVLPDASAIVEWMTATGLRPYLGPLNEDERAAFLAAYAAGIAAAYPVRADGRVLLPFPRLFMVAVRA